MLKQGRSAGPRTRPGSGFDRWSAKHRRRGRPEMREDKVLLSLRGVCTHFFLEQGVVRALDGVDFDIYRGHTLGVVGESGCGKSVTAQSILGIVPSPGKVV